MQSFQKARAFTVVELLVIIVVVFIFTVLLLPGPFFNQRHRQSSVRINCVNNLKQVGLAFRIWSGDNNDMYPMRCFTNTAGLSLFADATNGYRYFQVMSNELSTPKILVCPADKRTAATNFTTDFNGNHISYFIGLEADETYPQVFLTGDRNITNGLSPVNGILDLRSNQNIGWTKDLHNERGDIGLADGSVQQYSSSKLKESVAYTGLATNRILLP